MSAARGREAALAILSTAPPPAADADPYAGQECIGLEEPWVALYALLHGTVDAQEGNSCLLLGEHGCGKSLLVHSVLARVQHEQHTRGAPAPLIVTLSGLLHPTDRQCLADLAKQLMAQGALGQQETATLDTMLAEEFADADGMDLPELDASVALSDDDEAPAPAEPPTAEPAPSEAVASAILSTMATTLSHILTLLSHTPHDTARAQRPLLIVLDAFEQFAQRPRQALLYCLLDAVQAGSYGPGLAVVGMTTRVDAGDALEKRVKSRFSHRIIHVHPPSVEQYELIARTALRGGYNAARDDAWEERVERLVHDPRFRAFLHGLHDLSQDVRLLYQAMTVPVAMDALEPDAFLASADAQRADPAAALLLELTELEMAVLITARHLQMRDKEPFTWEMCFHELQQFVQRVRRDLSSAATHARTNVAIASLEALAHRDTAMQAFQSLLQCELLVPEPARLSLALPAGVATRTGAATNAYDAFPSAGVVPEFLPVRVAVSSRAILASTTDARRSEPLHSALVQWAASTGM
ncbi:origin recognition complex subunit 4 [Malassezia brasiliensis]|uniref:Origin recognition complex subunit 4 n=1 Tax=Malassezia brasiliensis TaxID=1821822 RepID=A0AAF0DUT9_9BASI|nr:origin recognition complex subunit 4 [Malassezia brasiliensis]